ncbi:hypothetical protein C8Q79DRAFT_760010 [Trametes meyenii]|nr:hypothetical protein C8Q79DRAFT_760010 [Trametes meyenii]
MFARTLRAPVRHPPTTTLDPPPVSGHRPCHPPPPITGRSPIFFRALYVPHCARRRPSRSASVTRGRWPVAHAHARPSVRQDSAAAVTTPRSSAATRRWSICLDVPSHSSQRRFRSVHERSLARVNVPGRATRTPYRLRSLPVLKSKPKPKPRRQRCLEFQGTPTRNASLALSTER